MITLFLLYVRRPKYAICDLGRIWEEAITSQPSVIFSTEVHNRIKLEKSGNLSSDLSSAGGSNELLRSRITWYDTKKESTRWDSSHLEKITVTLIVKKFPVFYGNNIYYRFDKRPPMAPILFQTNPIRIFPPISIRSILILSVHLGLCISERLNKYLFVREQKSTWMTGIKTRQNTIFCCI
jgi:hypothetical protein